MSGLSFRTGDQLDGGGSRRLVPGRLYVRKREEQTRVWSEESLTDAPVFSYGFMIHFTDDSVPGRCQSATLAGPYGMPSGAFGTVDVIYHSTPRSPRIISRKLHH
jgi:hypothetical protein